MVRVAFSERRKRIRVRRFKVLAATTFDRRGLLLSRLMVTDLDAVPPALCALQVNLIPRVSFVTVLGPQPLVEVTGEPASLTVQRRLTFFLRLYQPWRPFGFVPFSVMAGGDGSVAMRSGASARMKP